MYITAILIKSVDVFISTPGYQNRPSGICSNIWFIVFLCKFFQKWFTTFRPNITQNLKSTTELIKARSIVYYRQWKTFIHDCLKQ